MAEEYASFSGRFTSAFLQDADSLILPTHELIAVIEHIKKVFPNIERITTYARAKSMKRKDIEAYGRLREAGLTRIHTGMESGSRNVLKQINKGNTPEDILEGGKRVRESGISLSEYIMPGVGGRALSHEHAIETARILNQIQPDFIRVRTFAIHPKSPLQKMVDDGTFVPLNDDEVVSEIRMLLENLDEMPAHFRCGDFSLNLLMQVDGMLNTHKDAMIQEIDRYLALTTEQKQAYSLIQRTYPGMRSLDVVHDQKLIDGLKGDIEALEKGEKDGFNKHIRQLMTYQIPQLQTDCWD
jgi:histone acetyltransferase (RNA polymerase elongator complex component)